MTTQTAKLVRTYEDTTLTLSPRGQSPIVMSIEDFSPEMQRRLILAGLNQKVGDCFSSDDLIAGRASAEATIEALKAGQWNVSAGAGGTGYLAQAIANLTKMPLADITARLAAMDPDARKAAGKDAAIAAEVARLRTEALRAKAKAAPASSVLSAFMPAGDDTDTDE